MRGKILVMTAILIWSALLLYGARAQAQQSGWTMVDQLDIGERNSESGHSYRITSQTWKGTLTLSYPDGRRVQDDGRAHKGSEVWIVNGLTPNRSLKLVKRVDFSVADQITDVYVEGRYVGRWNVTGSSNNWRNAEFVIPGRFINASTTRIEQRFVSSAIDATAFHYWAYQEPAPTGLGGILGGILGGGSSAPQPQRQPERFGIDPDEQGLLDAVRRYVDSQQAILDALRRYLETH